MVKLHQSVDTCPCPGPARATSNRKIIEQAFLGAQILMKAGYDAVGKVFNECVSYSVERWFGTWTKQTRDIVLDRFTKMQQLVDHGQEADVTIHLGTDHLSGETGILLAGAYGRYPCVVDLTKVAYDTKGRFIGQTSTWPANTITPFQPGAQNPKAYCVVVDDATIGSIGGTHIFINPETLAQPDTLSPFVLDKGSLLEEDDHFYKITQLPGYLFNELCQPYLLGHKPYSSQDLETSWTVSGEEPELYSSPSSVDSDSWEMLHDVQNYLEFSLAMFLEHNGVDFTDGFLRVHTDMGPIPQPSTEEKADTERSLADCVYKVGDSAVKDLWGQYVLYGKAFVGNCAVKPDEQVDAGRQD